MNCINILYYNHIFVTRISNVNFKLIYMYRRDTVNAINGYFKEYIAIACAVELPSYFYK